MNREEIILRYQLSEDLLDAYLALGFQEITVRIWNYG